MPAVVDTPETTYREFFRADRAKDPHAWAAVNSYPHVRVAPGGIEYFETARDYASQASWTEREATGWVRTGGIGPERLHTSPDRVHLAGGWTRYNADDEPILSNRVVYVLTRIDRSWGIQARFACGAGPVWQSTDDAGPGDVVKAYLAALLAGDLSHAARFARYPLVRVGVGRVHQYESDVSFTGALGATPTGAYSTLEERIVHSGKSGATVAVVSRSPSGSITNSLFLVARHEARWRIAAMSIDPD